MRIQLLRGKELDFIAQKLGLFRRKILWFFKETDKSLRKRLENRVYAISSRKLVVLGCPVGRR